MKLPFSFQVCKESENSEDNTDKVDEVECCNSNRSFEEDEDKMEI